MSRKFRINLENLPDSVRKRLPLTLLVSKKEYDFDELPDNIKAIITDYFDKRPDEISYSEGLTDFSATTSEYNDFKPLGKKDAIIEYIKNYFSVLKGSYPFDVTYGSNIKKYLQMKDIAIVETLISNELKNTLDALSSSFKIPVNIISSRVSRNEDYMRHYSEYVLTMTIQVENEVVTITIS